jgi:ABC-type multidrug transport system fused ATPase/permease subunit
VTATAEVVPPPPKRLGRARRIIALVLVVFASITVLLGVVASWAQRTIVDDGEFTSIIMSAFEDPEVFDAVVATTSEQVVDLLESSGALDDVVPDRFERIEPLLRGAAETVIQDQVANLLSSDAAFTLFETAVQHAHGRAIELLQGDGLGDGVSVESGEVTLNLLPLIGLAVERLQDRGLVSSDVDVESALDSGSVQDQIDELADRFGIDLPDDLGQIVVYDSDSVADAEAIVDQAQNVFALFRRAVVLIDVFAVVFVAGALLVSTNRMRTLVQLGIGVGVALVVCNAVVKRVSGKVPDVVSEPGAKAATRTIVDRLAASLTSVTTLVIVFAVLAVGVGFVFGRSESARKLRERAVTTGGAAGRKGAGWASQLAVFATQHADGSRVAVLVAAVVLLTLFGLSWASFLIILVLVAAAFVAIAHFANQGASESDPSADEQETPAQGSSSIES